MKNTIVRAVIGGTGLGIAAGLTLLAGPAAAAPNASCTVGSVAIDCGTYPTQAECQHALGTGQFEIGRTESGPILIPLRCEKQVSGSGWYAWAPIAG